MDNLKAKGKQENNDKSDFSSMKKKIKKANDGY